MSRRVKDYVDVEDQLSIDALIEKLIGRPSVRW